MISKRIIVVVVILFLAGGVTFADYPGFTVQIAPGINIPVVGPESDSLGLGFTGGVGGNYHFSFFQPFSVGLHLAYGLSGLAGPDTGEAAESYSLSFRGCIESVFIRPLQIRVFLHVF